MYKATFKRVIRDYSIIYTMEFYFTAHTHIYSVYYKVKCLVNEKGKRALPCNRKECV